MSADFRPDILPGDTIGLAHEDGTYLTGKLTGEDRWINPGGVPFDSIDVLIKNGFVVGWVDVERPLPEFRIGQQVRRRSRSDMKVDPVIGWIEKLIWSTPTDRQPEWGYRTSWGSTYPAHELEPVGAGVSDVVLSVDIADPDGGVIIHPQRNSTASGEQHDQYRLHLVGPDGVSWYSEELSLTSHRLSSWVSTTMQMQGFGVALRRAEKFNPETQEWEVF